MWESFKAFWATDLGEAIIHCGIGAASGVSLWTLIAVAFWFHGREMGQHEDKILYISNPIEKPWVFAETYGPLLCGFAVWLLLA